MLGSRAIYPTRFLPFILLLTATKLCRSFGIFLAYDLLKIIHLVQFVFIVKTGTAVLLVFLQSPFSSRKRITKHQWFRVVRHAFVGSLINLLWLFGLSLCGPLRTLLLFEHSDLAVIAGAGAIFTNAGGPSKFRGAVFFLLAVMGLLLFDHDDYNPNMADHQAGHPHKSILTHIFSHITNLTGLSDHKGGVVLLFSTLCMQAGYNSAAKKLSMDIGGAKRLMALSTAMSALLLMPWAMFITVTRESVLESWFSLGIPMMLVTVGLTADFYVEAVCVNRMEAPRTARIGSHAALVGALVLSCLWNHPFVGHLTKTTNLRALIAEEHVLSGGVVFSFVLFVSATHILTSVSKATKGSLVGYSAAGLPLYSFTGDTLQRTSQSLLIIIRNGLRQILEETNSRRIFYFLCVNLSFTFVELVYGVWTNSLGLISDGFHMLFDCSALVMGLYAAVMTRWKPTRKFSYGFDRVEILSGFINGIFLIVISFFIFTAGISRMVDPPEIHTERLLTVSVAGLAVNLIGIAAFSHGHSHGGLSHGHSHGGHGHAHGGDAHGHSHGSGGHGHAHGVHAHGSHAHRGHAHEKEKCQGHGHSTHNSNMQGVFLHVLADTLGSVGVIISTLLIENFGWTRADPICSLLIAILIFLSVVPLVKETSLMLLLRTPEDLQEQLGVSLQKVLAIEGVLSYRDEHFWRHSSAVVCGTIHVQIKAETSEQKIQAAVQAILKEDGVNNLTVQVERETYFQHLSGLGLNMSQVYEMTSHMKALNYDNTANFIKAI